MTYTNNEIMNSWVCIDANIVIKALIPSDLEAEAEELLKRCYREGKTLIAPTHINFEVTSTLRSLVYHQMINPEQGEQAFRQYLRLRITTVSNHRILTQAWILAKKFLLLAESVVRPESQP